MIGEAYFDFRHSQYKLLHNRQAILPRFAIHHEGRDQCYYYWTSGKVKSAHLVDFTYNTQYVLYRSDNLQTTDWPQMRHYLMTTSPAPQLPHVSFPPTAFQPVKPHDIQMTNPLNYHIPIWLAFDPSQPPQNIATFILMTLHFQSEITPKGSFGLNLIHLNIKITS